MAGPRKRSRQGLIYRGGDGGFESAAQFFSRASICWVWTASSFNFEDVQSRASMARAMSIAPPASCGWFHIFSRIATAFAASDDVPAYPVGGELGSGRRTFVAGG